MDNRETRTIMLDGGTGTMLQARGMKAGEDSTAFALHNPDIVEDIARQYIEAGSQFVYTPTFNLNRAKVAGFGETVESLCLKLTAPARKLRDEYAAKGRNILIAFDMGPQSELVEPLGRLSFEDALDFYAEQARAAVKCGVDAIAIETMTDIYDTKAAVLAVKENTDLPLMVTMSFEESGRTFLGTGLENMAMVLQGLGADAIGINCSLGPAQILPLIKELMTYTDLPVIAKPNAGLPNPATGKYDIDCDEFVEIMKQYVDAEVAMVGGCCGTTPDYIRGIAEYISQGGRQESPEEGVGLYTGEFFRRPKGPLTGAIEAAHQPQDFTLTSLFGMEKPARPLKVCSGSKVVTVDHVTVIGERLNPTGKKKLKNALINRDFDYIIDQAMSQIEAGAEILDVNVGVPGIDEAALMPEVVKKLQAVTNLPLQIDSSNADAIEAALRVYNGKPIVNSVNGDEEVMERILPIVKKYGAAVIGLTLDAGGIPETCEERFEIAQRIVNRAEEYGIPREDIIIDCLTLTASAQQKEVDETLKTVRMVKEKLGLATALGVSNVSFGLPLRPVINRTFMTMALEEGLDLPIINPNDEDMMAAIYAFNVLKNRDEGAAEFIEKYKDAVPPSSLQRKKSAKAGTAAVTGEGAALTPEEAAVARAIENGLEGEAAKAIEALLKIKDPMDIVNKDLIPALDRVGKGFERGEIFLPSMLQSAQAAQAGFDVIKKVMDESGVKGENAGDVVIATVRGDIHDIGKNIVKVIMENYGFNMIDLGRDVPVEDVVEKVRSSGIRLVGLSALMTTTLASMEETIKALKAEDPAIKVMVGGAVLTEEYAHRMGADFYCSDAMKSVEAAQKVFAEMLLEREEK